MSWNPSPKVADCRDIANKWNVDQVIIVGIDSDGGIAVVSYGKTKQLCTVAKKFGEVIMESLQNFISSF